MPLSRPDTYPAVLNLVWETNPKSILDVGIGWGGMGVMFRQICDIRWGRMKFWNTVIHGIEINKEYHNPLWTLVYNNVFIGDALEKLRSLPENYDIIFMGDVVEHMDKVKAKELIDTAIQKADRYVLITTPATFSDNEAEALRFGNEHEAHKILVDEEIYPADATVEQYGNQKLIIINKQTNGEQKD